MTFLEDFHIDDGSMVGLDPCVAFCYGVEWHMVAELLKEGHAFSITIYAQNADRIVKLAEDRGRRVQSKWVNDDFKFIKVEEDRNPDKEPW